MMSGLGPFFDWPYAIFGHSMGGLIAFELTRALRAAGRPQPVHLFVSAIEAPGTPALRPRLGSAPDAEVKRALRSLNGTPPALLDNDELMALMMPVVRADFSVLETYEFREEPPLSMPITVFGGRSDQAVPPSVLSGWHRQSSRGARLQLFPGGHFFLQSAESDVVRAVARALEPAPRPEAAR
jgi:medium-chain acyl-[acyl-carrier-protein] hydrolase